MDVTCERCSTEYEFDDALVSERGTTVKCTNCGHLFKVRRTDGALPEQWVVRTVDGRELTFRMLRELQAAIGRAEISRDDVLSRGSSRPRRLGSIAELDPFFRGVGGMLSPGTAPGVGPPLPPRSRSLTPQGLGPDPAAEEDGPEPAPAESMELSKSGPPPPAMPFSRSPSAPPPPVSEPQSGEPMTPPVGRLPMMPPTPPPPVVESPRRSIPPGVVVSPDDAEEAPPLPEGYAARAPEAGAAAGAKEAAGEAAAAEEPAAPAGARGEAGPLARPAVAPAPAPAEPAPAPAAVLHLKPPRVPVMTPTPSDVRFSVADDAYAEPRFTSIVPSRRASAARWIVGLVAAGLLVLAGVILVPRYLQPSAPAPGRSGDERVAALVAEAEQGLLEGDVEGARDKLLQASALAEDDPKVAADLARLEAASADMRWLRLRLMEEQDPDRAVAQHDLEVALGRARSAVERAEKVAPDDAAVRRARVDLLRLQGEIGRARELVGALPGVSAQPESALTLAALDLAEAQPSWPVALGRLRVAAAGEQGLGRARAMLIYALARSGNTAAARAEHERLAAASRPHPLAPALRAFIDRLEGAEPASAGSARPDAGAGATAAPRPAPAAPRTTTRPRAAPSPGERVPDDYVAPDQGVPVDTSDLPGAKPVPAPAPEPAPAPAPAPDSAPAPEPAPAPAPTADSAPSEIDTSDLPELKP